jgi:hypothetical protein
VRQVIVASDFADDPFSKSAPILVGEADRSQHADLQRIQLRQSYRSDARSNVSFDDARRIGAVVEWSHIHGDMRPRRSGNVLNESGDARISVREENVTSIEHSGQGLWISARIGYGLFDRLGKVECKGGKQPAANTGEARRYPRQLSYDPFEVEAK